MINRIISRDVLLAALVASTGVLGLFLASPLPVGETARMGPGYMPHMTSWILIALASLIALRGILARAKSENANGETSPIPWRGIVFVSLGIAAFAFLIRPSGLFLASAVAVLLFASAEISSRLREKLVLAGAFAAASVLIFVIGLGLPLGIYPSFS